MGIRALDDDNDEDAIRRDHWLGNYIPVLFITPYKVWYLSVRIVTDDWEKGEKIPSTYSKVKRRV